MEKKNAEAWIRKSIVLSPNALQSAQELADNWYAGNLSAFFAARIEHAVVCEHCARNNDYKVRPLKAKTKRGAKKAKPGSN